MLITPFHRAYSETQKQVVPCLYMFEVHADRVAGKTSAILIALGITFHVLEDAEPAPQEILQIPEGRAQAFRLLQGGSLAQAGLEPILQVIKLLQDFSVPVQALAAGRATVSILCDPTST
jgi:hypothetical protein